MDGLIAPGGMQPVGSMLIRDGVVVNAEGDTGGYVVGDPVETVTSDGLSDLSYHFDANSILARSVLPDGTDADILSADRDGFTLRIPGGELIWGVTL